MKELKNYDKNPEILGVLKDREIIFKYSYLDEESMSPMISSFLIGDVVKVEREKIRIKVREDFYDPEDEN